MPIPASAVGSTTEPLTVLVERGRLQLFAKATGQTDPVYTDVAAARAEGHPDLPVPPTWLFGLELERPDPFGWITDLGVDMTTVLHGEQSFELHTTAHAGDALTTTSVVTGVSSKRGGALELVERRTDVTREGEPVATLLQTIVVRAVAA